LPWWSCQQAKVSRIVAYNLFAWSIIGPPRGNGRSAPAQPPAACSDRRTKPHFINRPAAKSSTTRVKHVAVNASTRPLPPSSQFCKGATQSRLSLGLRPQPRSRTWERPCAFSIAEHDTALPSRQGTAAEPVIARSDRCMALANSREPAQCRRPSPTFQAAFDQQPYGSASITSNTR